MKLFLLLILLLLIVFICLLIVIEIKMEIREDNDVQESCLNLVVRIKKQQILSIYKEIQIDPQLGMMFSCLAELWERRQRRAQEKPAEDIKKNNKCKVLFGLKCLPIYMSIWRDLYKLVNKTLHYITIDELAWKTTTGHENAAKTALNTGILWMLKGNVLGPLSRKCKLKTVKVNVVPDFGRPAFFTSFTCILKIRIVHIMIIASYAIVIIVRWWINGFPARTKVEPSH